MNLGKGLLAVVLFWGLVVGFILGFAYFPVIFAGLVLSAIVIGISIGVFKLAVGG